MNTLKEENPITYRMDQMRKNWEDHVFQEAQLVRWLIKKDEVRMVKAFSLLEGSEHGKIPELFLHFEIPFSSAETYGKDLMDSWLTLWNSEEARKEIEHANALPDWNDAPYQNCPAENSGPAFFECMSSFARSVAKDQMMVIHVMPASYTGDPNFVQWVFTCLKKLPSNLRLMIYDLDDQQVFHKIPPEIKTVTLHANLDMHMAMQQIIQQGDVNDPAVGVNLCLLHISEAVNQKDEKEINRWGKKGLKMAKATHLKSIEATVLLAYGSAFYQLKKFKDALHLFHKAEVESIKGLETKDTAIPAVLLQTYNFQASVYLVTQKYDRAQAYFLKTSEESLKQKNTVMYIDARRQAAFMAEKQYKKDEAYTLLYETYEGCKKENKTSLKFSSMLLLCIALHKYAFEHKNRSLMEEISDFASDIWGEHWKNMSQKEAYQTVLTA